MSFLNFLKNFDRKLRFFPKFFENLKECICMGFLGRSPPEANEFIKIIVEKSKETCNFDSFNESFTMFSEVFTKILAKM